MRIFHIYRTIEPRKEKKKKTYKKFPIDAFLFDNCTISHKLNIRPCRDAGEELVMQRLRSLFIWQIPWLYRLIYFSYMVMV